MNNNNNNAVNYLSKDSNSESKKQESAKVYASNTKERISEHIKKNNEAHTLLN